MELVFQCSEHYYMLVTTIDNSDNYNFCLIACFQKDYYTNILSSLSKLIFYDLSLILLSYICLDALILIQSVATFFSHVMSAIGGNTAGPG